MKKTGYKKTVDETGRIALPAELMDKVGVKKKDYVEIYLEDNCIIIKAIREKCAICNAEKLLNPIRNKMVCNECVNIIKQM